MKQLGIIWRNLNPDQKKPYEDLFQKEKQEFEKQNEGKSNSSSNSVKKTSTNSPEGKRKKRVLKSNKLSDEEKESS